MRISPVALPTISGLTIATLATLNHFLNDGYASMLGPLGPALREHFHTSIGSIAFLAAVFSFTSSFLQPFLGILGERLDRRVMMALGPAFTGIGLTLMGQMPSFGFLIVLVGIAGLGSGFFHPAGAAYVAQNSPASRRGLWASWFSAGGTAGMALGPIFATRLGLPNLHWAMPLGIILGAICFVLTPSAKSQRGSSHISQYLEVFRGPMVKLWGMAVLRTLTATAYGSLLPFILKARGYGDTEIAISLVLMALGTAIGGIVGGRISDKIGRIPVLRSSIALVIPFYVLLILSDPSRVWFYPLAFVVSAVINASIPVGVVTAQEYAPKQVALASSIMMGFSWGTAGMLYWFVGLLADAIGPIQASLWSVVLLLPSIWLASQLPEPSRVGLERERA